MRKCIVLIFALLVAAMGGVQAQVVSSRSTSKRVVEVKKERPKTQFVVRGGVSGLVSAEQFVPNASDGQALLGEFATIGLKRPFKLKPTTGYYSLEGGVLGNNLTVGSSSSDIEFRNHGFYFAPATFGWDIKPTDWLGFDIHLGAFVSVNMFSRATLLPQGRKDYARLDSYFTDGILNAGMGIGLGMWIWHFNVDAQVNIVPFENYMRHDSGRYYWYPINLALRAGFYL